MRILADESVDQPVIQQLRDDGFAVESIRELSPGITDDEVLTRANVLDAVLLTEDKDFGELVYRLGRVTRGVVLIRLEGHSPARRAEIVSNAFDSEGVHFPEAFTVVSSGLVRIRPSAQDESGSQPGE
jgi:predicted nuclease of predicted toxin-antitoxin system